jgi:hypothetical protein
MKRGVQKIQCWEGESFFLVSTAHFLFFNRHTHSGRIERQVAKIQDFWLFFLATL